MTSPNIGSAEVDVNAYVDEQELADAARKAGAAAGDSASESFMQRFRRRIRQRIDSGFDAFTGGSVLRSAGTSGAIYATRFAFAFRRTLRRASLTNARDFTGRFLSALNRQRGFDRFAIRITRSLADAFTGIRSALRGANILDLAAVEIAGRAFGRRFMKAVGSVQGGGMLGALTGDGFFQEDLARHAREVAGRWRELLRNSFGGLRDLDFAAVQAADRFVARFGAVLSRGRGLLDSLNLGGRARAVDAAALDLARRFTASFRNGIRRLGGPEVYLQFDDGTSRQLSGYATRLGRVFTDAFRGSIRLGRGVFGRGGLIGELLGRGFAAVPRLLGAAGRAAAGLFGVVGRLGAGAGRILGRVTAGLGLLGSVALRSFGILGAGAGLFARGLGRVLGPLQRYVALAGALAVVTVPFVPLIGRLYNGLLDIAKGFGVAIPAALAVLGGSVLVFKLGAEGLKQATTPLRDAFRGLDDQLSATFLRGGLQEASRVFSRRQVPAIRRGLAQLTAGYRDFIAAGLDAGAVTGFGTALERVGVNARGFLTNFSGALVPISTILNRMLTQVSDTFPELGRRLDTFFTQLEVRSRGVDFGEIFLTGLQGAINLGKAIGELGGALSDFFTAANGGDRATSAAGDGPFAGLLANVRELRDWVRENRGGIEGFFDGLGTVMGKLGTASKGVGRFIRDVFEPLQEYFTSQDFKDGFRDIEGALTRMGAPAAGGGKSVGTLVGESLTIIADTIVENGPEIIDFFEDLSGIAVASAPALDAVARGIDAVNRALDNGEGESGVNNPGAELGGKLGERVRKTLAEQARIIRGELSGFFGGMARDLQSMIDEGLFTQGQEEIGRRMKEAFIRGFSGTIVIGFNFTSAVTGLLGRLRPHIPTFLSIGNLSVRNFTTGFSWQGVLGTGLSTAVAVLLGRLRLNIPSFSQIAQSGVRGFISGFNWNGTLGSGLIRAARALLAILSDLADQIATAARGIFTAAGSAGGRGAGALPNGGVRAGANPRFGRRGVANSSSPQGIGRRADGGFVTRPEVSWIGEAGPELVLPLTRPKRMDQLLAEAGLTRVDQSTSRVEVRAPITVYSSNPERAARQTADRLARMVR